MVLVLQHLMDGLLDLSKTHPTFIPGIDASNFFDRSSGFYLFTTTGLYAYHTMPSVFTSVLHVVFISLVIASTLVAASAFDALLGKFARWFCLSIGFIGRFSVRASLETSMAATQDVSLLESSIDRGHACESLWNSPFE